MSGKYEVKARNYEDVIWMVLLYTNSRLKALRVWFRALRKYELVEFVVRK